MLGASSSRSQASYGSSQILQVAESVYRLYEPAGRPSIQVVFFHGLQLAPDGNAHSSTWKSEDGSCIWPQEWLVEEIPEAQVFSVSCSGILRNSSNDTIDMFILGENLISDLLSANIGQLSNCPIVLVGHSMGGLVIKELCCQAHSRLQGNRDFERAKVEKFLKSMRGVFYYATPHHGSPAADSLADKIGGALLKYFKTLSTDTERLNSTFDAICKVYEKWQFAGLGEGRPTNLVHRWFYREMVGPEASVRKDNFNVAEGADHFCICQPSGKTSRSFYKLKDFLMHIIDEMKVAMPIHECHGLPKYPIGLEKCALDVTEKLIGGATLGISGMGGIGKTTLAMWAFNIISKDFEYTCFVDNVKGIPIHELQERVLNHFHHNGIKSDKGSIQWFHLNNKTTLIAMDDIDAEDQLKVLPNLQHFGTGSRVIMTSRDREVFKYYEGCIIHEVEFLKDDDANKLFCQHAFGSKDLPDFLIDLVNAVVKKCDGLPLTLEVMGTYLRDHGTNVEVWKETIVRLRETRAITGGKKDRVWTSLRISYDALLKEEREMFREAALFFFERRLDRALAAWSNLTQTMQTTWGNLVSRSLVKEINNKVWVHEHLRDLAENISKGIMVDGADDTANSAVDLLNDKKVKAKTKYLSLLYTRRFRKNRRTLQLDSLARLRGLKYMDLDGVSTVGSGKGLTRKISFLELKGVRVVQLPKFEFSLNQMENLAVLELSNFRVPKELSEALGNLTNLRILCLTDLEGLVHLPENFGNLSRLRRLELQNLRSLTLPESFGSLRALEHLVFCRINFLALPETLENLSCLATLYIDNCEGLAGLPDSFGRSLTLLEEVHIIDCPLIKCLPQSFSRLSGLKKLNIRNCFHLEELGDAFGNLSSLQQLYLVKVALQRIPASFSHLSALESLHIDTVLQSRSFPVDFAQWTALKNLNISSDDLETLPERFCFPKSLREFTIHCPKLEMLPETLGEFALLEELRIYVDRVVTLPSSVGKLYSLRHLAFESSVAKLLPESLDQLSSLKILELHCPCLEKLPDTLGKLPSLKELSISSSSLASLPESLVQLSSIKILSLSSRHMEKLPDVLVELLSVEELAFSLPLLESLPETIGGLHNLRTLSMTAGKKLKRLPDNFGHLIALQDLSIYANELQRLPDNFFLLKFLKILTIQSSKMERLPGNMGNVSSLEDLWIHAPNLESLPDSTPHLHSLRTLTLIMAKTLKSLPEDFGKLIKLQDLRIEADELRTLPDSFSRLKSLQNLTLDCSKLERLPDDFGNLSALEKLSISTNSLEYLPQSIGWLHSLKELKLDTAKTLKSLPDSLGNLRTLQILTICSDELETLPDSISFLNSMNSLTIDCSNLETLPDSFRELSQLNYLYIIAKKARALPLSLGNLSSLRHLEFNSSVAKVLPDSMGQLYSLKSLKLDCSNLENLPNSFGKLSSLETLELDCRNLEKLPNSFGKLSSLETLSINAGRLETLPESIGQLSSLETLELNCRNLEKLPNSFGKLSSLETLSIKSGRLESLPESVGQLQSLNTLLLVAGKSLRSLPDGIGQISSLQKFEFDCDGHEETPDLFAHMSSFAHELSLTGRDTRILPAGLGSVSSLRALSLDRLWLLETLPDELGMLSSLERLTITGCDVLEILPDSLGQVSSLKEVTIVDCERLKTLPESLGKSSSTKQALPQRDQSDEPRLQAEESSPTKKAEAMRLFVDECPLLDDSKLQSLGWMYIPSFRRRRTYRRKPPIEDSGPG